MLKRTLNRMIEKKQTSAREIAEFAGVSTSTVYRWIAGESQPDFDSIRLLVRHLPNRKAQEALLHAFTTGSGWTFTRPDHDLDVNRDGAINSDDALDAAIEAVRTSSHALKEVRTACLNGNTSAEQTLNLIQLLHHTTQQCTIAQHVLMHMSDEASKRKKAKLKLAR